MPLFEIISRYKIRSPSEPELADALSRLVTSLGGQAGDTHVLFNCLMHDSAPKFNYYFWRGGELDKRVFIMKVYVGNQGPEYIEALREGILRVWRETVNPVGGKKPKLRVLPGTVDECLLGSIFFVPGVAQWEG